jgi:hypothetical protein
MAKRSAASIGRRRRDEADDGRRRDDHQLAMRSARKAAKRRQAIHDSLHSSGVAKHAGRALSSSASQDSQVLEAGGQTNARSDRLMPSASCDVRTDS